MFQRFVVPLLDDNPDTFNGIKPIYHHLPVFPVVHKSHVWATLPLQITAFHLDKFDHETSLEWWEGIRFGESSPNGRDFQLFSSWIIKTYHFHHWDIKIVASFTLKFGPLKLAETAEFFSAGKYRFWQKWSSEFQTELHPPSPSPSFTLTHERQNRSSLNWSISPMRERPPTSGDWEPVKTKGIRN